MVKRQAARYIAYYLRRAIGQSASGMGESTNYHGNHRTVAGWYREVRLMPRDCDARKGTTAVDTVRDDQWYSRLGIRFSVEFSLSSRPAPRQIIASTRVDSTDEGFRRTSKRGRRTELCSVS